VLDVPGLIAFDLLGVVAFGLSGALLGIRQRFDLFGIVALSAVTGTGGGMIRDALIGATPATALRDWRYLACTLAAALGAVLLARLLARLERSILVFDAFGLGVFAFTGTSAALGAGLPFLGCVVVGVITGVGGGMLRDLLAGQVPLVLRREVYATAAALGAVVTWVGGVAEAPPPAVAAAATVVTAGGRLLALRLDVHLPRPRPG
jgi:uncharacterized membrane protein YeiH